jgi:type I restriction enzyme S subunit
VSEETYVSRSSRGEIEPGDIILSREGTVGIMAIVPEGHRMCLGQRLVQVKPNTGLMTAQFLMNYLLFLLDPARLKQSMVGSTAQHLNVKELRDLKCLTPLLSLQSEFSARVLAIQDTKTAHQAALAELNVLFASLQNQVFRGDSN